MDDSVPQLLERIASSLELIAESLAAPRSHLLVGYSEYEWENRDINDLYAELEEEKLEFYADKDWFSDLNSDEPHSNTDRDYFDAMTDGMLGDYDSFADRGGTTDWISDWSGR